MKKLLTLGILVWSMYFAVFPALLNAAVLEDSSSSEAEYASCYNDGAEIVRSILDSVGEEVFIDSIGRIASEMQNMGGVKSLESEEFSSIFVEETTKLVNMLALSLDEETLSAISSGPIFELLSNLTSSAGFQDFFKSINSVDTVDMGFGKDVQQGGILSIPASMLSTITSIFNTFLSPILGTATGAAGAGAVGAGAIGVDVVQTGVLLSADGAGALASAIVDALQTAGLLSADVLAGLGGIAGAEVIDLIEKFVVDIVELLHFPTVLGAGAYGAGSGFLLGTISSALGRILATPVWYALTAPFQTLFSLGDGVLMGFIGGFAGLAVGVLGYIASHLMDVLTNFIIIPGLDYNSTYWTVGGAAIVAALGAIGGAIGGALLGAKAGFTSIPVLYGGISGIVHGAIFGALSGMILGGGAGLIALSGA